MSREISQADDRWIVGVIGLGYVGLPLLVSVAERGYMSVGFDTNPGVIETLERGSSHVDDISSSRIAHVLKSGLVDLTADEEKLGKADAIFICVPSPLGRNRQPDLSYIEHAAAIAARVVKPGALVSLESTSYPGTTESIVAAAFEDVGKQVDEDFYLCFSPERIDPGSATEVTDIPRIVGGVTPASTAAGVAAYRRLANEVHPVSNARTAEMAKLLENTYRAVNIALVNEMTQLSDLLKIDIWEVIEAASTKPFGFTPFYPGPGVGGHCIPLDPLYLAWRAREEGFVTRFIDHADEVNRSMPRYTSSRIGGLLNVAGKSVQGSRILGVGIAYKPNVTDSRESPASAVVDILVAQGADVSVADPLVGAEGIRALGYAPFDLPPRAEEAFDLAVILTDHDAIPYVEIAEHVPVVLDTRNAFRRRGLVFQNVNVL
jgi:UDP-N-acetyl-D-glucosamine dehydrogenase